MRSVPGNVPRCKLLDRPVGKNLVQRKRTKNMYVCDEHARLYVKNNVTTSSYNGLLYVV